MMSKRPTDYPLHLELIDQQHPLRAQAEAYVAQRYELAFDAHIQQFMPSFLGLVQQSDIRSLCGIRDASKEALFLEQYLDFPIEEIIQQLSGCQVERKDLIEFGQLASFSKGLSPLHFYLITRQLVAMGYTWCVCTVTDTLFALFKRLGLDSYDVALADAARVENAQQWGRYYQHQPRIIVGNLVESLARLEAIFATYPLTSLSQEA